MSFDAEPFCLAKRLAKLLFPEDGDCRKHYRQALSELRAQLKVTEKLASSGQWGAIKFDAVPSRAHKNLKAAFHKHVPQKYQDYLSQLQRGKARVNTRGLHPHEVIARYINDLYMEEPDQLIEGQWKAMLSSLRKSVHLSRAVSMVDVSGSMNGTPMEVAIALGLITATLCTGPFHGKVLTFSSDPAWHEIPTDKSLQEQVQSLFFAKFGDQTDIVKAFDVMLNTAVTFNVPPVDMPETLFIYSDMQFGQAAKDAEPAAPDVLRDDQKMSTHEVVKQRYAAAGYLMPRVVYWNLRGDTSDYPTQNEQSVALVSGFSADLLKIFTQSGEFLPASILAKAVGHYEAEVDPNEV